MNTIPTLQTLLFRISNAKHSLITIKELRRRSFPL
jgi:hypothetical protein